MLQVEPTNTPMSGTLLLRAARELRPSIVDTVPALLEAMGAAAMSSDDAGASARHGAARHGAAGLALSADAAATLRGCTAVLYGGVRCRRVPPSAAECRRVLPSAAEGH